MKRSYVLAVVLMLVPVMAWAAPPHGRGMRGPGGPGMSGHKMGHLSPQQRARHRAQRRAARAAALQAEVALPAAKHARLVAIFDRFDVQRAKLRRELHRTGRALHLLVRAGETDDATFKLAIDRMMAARSKSSALREQEFAAMRKVLTPKQTAQLMVALPRIHKSVRKAMKSAHKSRLRQRALELLKQRD